MSNDNDAQTDDKSAVSEKYRTQPVMDSKGHKIPNLVTRNGQYYISCQVGRKRFLRKSPYNQLTLSKAWVKTFLAEARQGKWEKLNMAKARGGTATLGAIFAAYRTAAVNQLAIDGKPSEKTVENNIGQLKNIIRQVEGVENVEALGAEVLSKGLVEGYFRLVVDQGGSNNDMIKRKRITAGSSVRQAKSVFTKWALSWYEDHDIALPQGVKDFLKAGKTVKPDKYGIPSPELRMATHAAAEELRQTSDPIFAAYCLCYDLGMRAGEAVEAKWDWIEMDGEGKRFMHVCRRPDWQPKNRKSRRIPIPQALWDSLQVYRTPGNDYILPGTGSTARRNLITRDMAAWMRNIGWNREKYPKAAHELRKLAGSLWYTKAGLQWAASWLGDTPETVYHSYADATELGPVVAMR